MIRRTRAHFRAGLAAGALLALVVGAVPSYAATGFVIPHFVQINQVADNGDAPAAILDPDVVNPWGLALSPTGPLWVTNNVTSTATVYSGGVGGAPVGKVPLTVTILGGPPTGTVFNDTPEFVVSTPNGSGPALFIFAGEDGDITAWNPSAAATAAVKVAHVDGARYEGLTLLRTPFGPFLLATDFHNGRIDMFDSRFARVPLPDYFFRDSRLPKGYAPFNVLAIGDQVYVTYARQDTDRLDEVAGAGYGFVNLFTNLGLTVRRIASRGSLNAPWGLTIAPESFGQHAGALLVGNVGDGRISVFRDNRFRGQLLDQRNERISIEGLRALLPGTDTSGGTGTLWFSAGPDRGRKGLVGQLIPADLPVRPTAPAVLG